MLGLGSRKTAEGIFDLRLEAPEIVSQAAAGQFVSLYSGDGARLLPRPSASAALTGRRACCAWVYRIAGAGTEAFSHLKAGDGWRFLAPWEMDFLWSREGRLCLSAEALGIPPMLELAAAFSQANREAGERTAWCSPC